jgi:murein DD-endopeptidase MepM/ murein hydrolase activator NlpD
MVVRSVFAWDAPWKHRRDAVSPWSNDLRRENREGFFERLSQGFTAQSKAEVVVEEVEASEKDPEIEDIPWAAHSTLYPQEKFSSKLVWPVEGGRLASGYGIRAGHFHEGLDISASEGTSIHSIADGRVVFAGLLGTYGRIIVIYHGDGISSVYAHNSVNLKGKGARVQRGEAIALVGQTGRAKGPHCHFEMRKDGKPTNPLRYTYSKEAPLPLRTVPIQESRVPRSSDSF